MTSSHDAIVNPPTTLLGRLRCIGPSLILTATLVGSGELLVTTTLGAKYGFVALWIILLACIVKVALQEAFGRYTICSGDTALQAFNRLPGPRWRVSWAVWFWFVVVLTALVQMGAIAFIVGEALALVLPQLDAQVWAPLVCLTILAILISGKYEAVERTSALMVMLFSLSIMVSAIMIQWSPYAVSWQQIKAGFTFELPAGGWPIALSLIGIVGLSSTEILVYPYWCLEKGYARFTGPNDSSEAWRQRAKGWIKVMQWDCYLALTIYTTTTIAFYFLGAAVLHARGQSPEGLAVIETLTSMYTETFGAWAYTLFVAAAILVLYSTLFGTIASLSRQLPDCLGLLGVIDSNDPDRHAFWIRVFLVILAFLFCVASVLTSLLSRSPVWLLVIASWSVALFLLAVAFGVIYLRYRRLDPAIAPSPGLDVWLWISGGLTSVLTIYTLIKTILG